jgi:hypothetical protein
VTAFARESGRVIGGSQVAIEASTLVHGAVVGVPVDGRQPGVDLRPPTERVRIALGEHVDDLVAAGLAGQAAAGATTEQRRAVERLLAARPELRSVVEVHLVGRLTESDRRAIASDAVHARGYLPHSECLDVVRSADLLFLPMHNLAPGHRARIVPGKTYEYLASGRPILAAVPDGDARDLLARSGASAMKKDPRLRLRGPFLEVRPSVTRVFRGSAAQPRLSLVTDVFGAPLQT